MKLFSDSDFASLTFPIHNVDKDLINKVPRLELIPSFKNYKGDFKDRIIKYICYLYDPNSPLKEFFPDMLRRKEQAAILSGFDLEDNRTKDIIEGVMSLKNKGVLSMIDEYLRFVNSRTWSMIVSNEETFYEYQSKLLRSVEAERDKDLLQALQIKGKIMEDLDNINERLEKYYLKLYAGDEDLVKTITTRRTITPENLGDVY
jgi:hypothetical protein